MAQHNGALLRRRLPDAPENADAPGESRETMGRRRVLEEDERCLNDTIAPFSPETSNEGAVENLAEITTEAPMRRSHSHISAALIKLTQNGELELAEAIKELATHDKTVVAKVVPALKAADEIVKILRLHTTADCNELVDLLFGHKAVSDHMSPHRTLSSRRRRRAEDIPSWRTDEIALLDHRSDEALVIYAVCSESMLVEARLLNLSVIVCRASHPIKTEVATIMALTNIVRVKVLPRPVLSGKLAKGKVAFRDVFSIVITLHAGNGLLAMGSHLNRQVNP